MDEYSQRLFSLLFEITPKLNGFSYPNLNFQDKYSSLLSGHACYLKKLILTKAELLQEVIFPPPFIC